VIKPKTDAIMPEIPNISDLAKEYANGTKSFRQIQNEGIASYTEILAALADLNLKVPMARDIGPNVETRRAGMKRLASILRAS
jgi:hypothetical protein